MHITLRQVSGSRLIQRLRRRTVGRPGGRAAGRVTGQPHGTRCVVPQSVRSHSETFPEIVRRARRGECGQLSGGPGVTLERGPKSRSQTEPGTQVRKVEHPRWVFNFSYLGSWSVLRSDSWNHFLINMICFFTRTEQTKKVFKYVFWRCPARCHTRNGGMVVSDMRGNDALANA